MGVVYRGFDPLIGRTVALKTLSIDTTDPQAREFRDRLYREAAAAGALSHPNIVTIFDIIEDGGVTAVAMKYIEGRSTSRAGRSRPSSRSARRCRSISRWRSSIRSVPRSTTREARGSSIATSSRPTSS
jgi:serine/threonine-protein kinase